MQLPFLSIFFTFLKINKYNKNLVKVWNYIKISMNSLKTFHINVK